MQARGLIANLCARLLWGGASYYFSLSTSTDARSLFVFRLYWAFAFACVFCIGLKRGEVLLRSLSDWRSAGVSMLAALLISSNWFVVIQSVTSGQLLIASLGFYLSPILTVCCGIVFLGERFNTWVALSLALCVMAVVLLFHRATSLPWQVLYVASTSTAYAYVRKRWPLPAVVANTVETAIATLVAPSLFLALTGGEWKVRVYDDSLAYLMGLGVVTTLPMLLYVYSLDKISLGLVGYLQYVTPTLMLAISVLVLGEAVSSTRVLAIALLWASIAVWVLSRQQLLGARLRNQEAQ